LFGSEVVTRFTSRVYLIISVVMLFILAYSFMTVIINPDNMTKGNSSPGKIVKNIIVSLLVLVFTPTAFNYAYGVQTSLIKYNVVGKLVLGTENSSTDLNSMSGEFTTTVFTGSFYLADDYSEEAQVMYDTAVVASKMENNINAFSEVIPYVQSGDIEYNFIISTVVGLFVLYILVTFIFDLGLRAVKLAFLELFAPVPALLYMIPGKEKSLNSWFKETLQTFFEVFVRVGVLFFCVYLISEVDRSIDNILGFNQISGFMVRNICRLFVIIGILLFAKQAPQLICDILGIKNDGGLLSLKKRLNDTKEAIAPVLKPIDRTIGAIAGLHYANKARRIGEKVRGKTQSKGQSIMTTAGGLINGFRSGTRNAGYAFDYEMTNQQWYSSPEYEQMTGMKRTAAGIDNRLRNNFGAPSLYREKEAKTELEYNYELSQIELELSRRKQAADEKITKIDDKFDPIIKRDNDYIKGIKDIEDHCNSKVQKEDSEIVIDGIQTAEYDAATQSWKAKTLSTEGNYSAIQAVIDQLKDNENIDPALRTQLITANTKLQKQLGGIYKEAVENGGYTTQSGTYVQVKPDVELSNYKDALKTIISQHGNSLGLDENGNRSYGVIDENSNLKDLHDKLDDIKTNNASGKKNVALVNETATYIDRNGNQVTKTLYEIKDDNDKDEKKKKELSEKKAAEQMALSGYQKMDEITKKGFYKGNRGNK